VCFTDGRAIGLGLLPWVEYVRRMYKRPENRDKSGW